MTERWKYDVIKKFDNCELRKFHASVFADVTVQSPYSAAGSIGFRPLVTYISQNQIEMTAPVLQERIDEESWIISFVMPEGKSISSLPLAKNSTVILREEPEHVAAVISFKGFSSWNTVKEKEDELREFLAQEKIKSIGPSRIARFDPPWMPGFLRHNEVVIPIENMGGD